jgi:TFIIF-interacting CTD phosphatase-like protein
MLPVGESVVAKYLDFKIIPSDIDPEKEVVQYKLEEQGMPKYWKNGSGKIMSAFDGFTKGKTWVKITRSPMLDKAGKVIEGKTVYAVEETTEPVIKAEDIAWDDDKPVGIPPANV